MSKESRSNSLPARPVLSGGMRKTSGGLREKGNIKKREKEQEIEVRIVKLSRVCIIIL